MVGLVRYCMRSAGQHLPALSSYPNLQRKCMISSRQDGTSNTTFFKPKPKTIDSSLNTSCWDIVSIEFWESPTEQKMSTIAKLFAE